MRGGRLTGNRQRHPAQAQATADFTFGAKGVPGIIRAMTNSTAPALPGSPPGHVYLRAIDPAEKTSLSVVAGWIKAGSTVLDLGTGSGALGAYLSSHKQCVVDGVTYNDAEADLARPAYRRVEVADLEVCDLQALCGERRYDCIVCADVLEHVRFPEQVLRACRGLLAPGGRLILSIPNAAYAGLLGELMAGELLYRDEGLLDRTHVRFFTRRSLLRLVQASGWFAQRLQTVERDIHDSEFRQDFDRLPPAVARHVLTLPDALTYQLVLEAALVPASAEAVAQLMPEVFAEGRAVFSAQVYVGMDGAYAEDRKVLQAGTMGVLRQTLVFPLPMCPQRIDRLRLDPADRPGYLHLHGMTLRNAQGAVVWSWRFDVDGLAGLQGGEQHQWSFRPEAEGQSCAVAFLLGDDPWIELPVQPLLGDPDTDVRGGRLEVELGWPMSADYQALADVLEPMRRHVHALENERDALRRPVADRSADAAVEVPVEPPPPTPGATPWWRRWLAAPTVVPSVAQPMVPSAPEPCVDIIVPVYSGLADTRRCIESVLASLCVTPYRLVVINDASPEPAITEWLRQVQRKDTRITLLENPENLGFVATVNRGMALSAHHDVVLLNSDTEVANDWLDRLRQAAHGHGRVGSVTPFSNNATICSYPRFCQDNPLPAIGTRALDHLFAQCNAGEVVDVPTGVGFCMYIRRDCLRDVGWFDVANFGRGYGEENDFCVRAAHAGWRNLHALDTFVHHAGGVSFGDSKRDRELAAMETLRRLHPGYEPAVHRFVQHDPARVARERVDRRRIAETRLPVVLLLSHNRGGGTARHIHELMAELAGQALCLTLLPVDVGQLCLKLWGDSEAFQLRFDAATGFEDLVYTLKGLGVDHVHYHHMVDHADAMLTLANRLGVSYDFTAHDFYSYCPQINLADDTRRYCGEPDVQQCASCLKRTPETAGVDIQAWRGDWGAFLRGARHVFAPSQDTARRLAMVFPGIPLLVVPHTDLDGGAALPVPAPVPRSARQPLRMAVLGAVSDIKGADTLAQVALLARQQGRPLEVHLLGYVANEFTFPDGAHVAVHGRYDEAQLLPLLTALAIDVVWFPAQWPETYSYTLSAALQSGLPVVAPDLGAFSERLDGRAWTWLQPWDMSAQRWVDLFESIRVDHLVPGLAPPPARGMTVARPRFPGARWFYAKHYVAGLRKRGTWT